MPPNGARASLCTELPPVNSRLGYPSDLRLVRLGLRIELAPSYCKRLEARSSRLARPFKVVCKDYRTAGILDSDYITWWGGHPPLLDVEVLRHLHQEYLNGRIRATAIAVALFDQQWAGNADHWPHLRKYSIWSESVSFDERAQCLWAMYHPQLYQRLSNDTFDRTQTCARARGVRAARSSNPFLLVPVTTMHPRVMRGRPC